MTGYNLKSMLDTLLGRLGAIGAGIGLLLALPTLPNPLSAQLGIWLIPVRIVALVLLLGGLLALFGAPLQAAWRRRDWRPGGARPNLHVEPTSGPGTDVRLVVTNQGRPDQFEATATIVATRNDPNERRQGTYMLRWVGCDSNRLALGRSQRHALIVAQFEILGPLAPGWDHMGEVRLMEWGTERGVWAAFRWTFGPDERLPEYDLDVTIVGVRASRPLRRGYTLRPARWMGPMELVDR
jgi:hypothetical protein